MSTTGFAFPMGSGGGNGGGSRATLRPSRATTTGGSLAPGSGRTLTMTWGGIRSNGRMGWEGVGFGLHAVRKEFRIVSLRGIMWLLRAVRSFSAYSLGNIQPNPQSNDFALLAPQGCGKPGSKDNSRTRYTARRFEGAAAPTKIRFQVPAVGHYMCRNAGRVGDPVTSQLIGGRVHLSAL